VCVRGVVGERQQARQANDRRHARAGNDGRLRRSDLDAPLKTSRKENPPLAQVCVCLARRQGKRPFCCCVSSCSFACFAGDESFASYILMVLPVPFFWLRPCLPNPGLRHGSVFNTICRQPRLRCLRQEVDSTRPHRLKTLRRRLSMPLIYPSLSLFRSLSISQMHAILFSLLSH